MARITLTLVVLLLTPCALSSLVKYDSTPTTTAPTPACRRARICGCGTEDIKDGWMNYDNYTFWEPFSHPSITISENGCGGKTEILTRDLTTSHCPDADHCGPMPSNPFGPAPGPGWPENMKCVERIGNMDLQIATTFYNRTEATSRSNACSITIEYPFRDASSLGYSLAITAMHQTNTWDTSTNLKFLNQTGTLAVAMGEARTGVWYDKPVSPGSHPHKYIGKLESYIQVQQLMLSSNADCLAYKWSG
jgi:hypothetical protein